MPKYKFVHTRSWTGFQEYWEEFNVDDQEKWNRVLEDASLVTDENKLKKFPKKAPLDPVIWFELYSLLDEESLENPELEDFSDEQNHEFSLYDEDGNWVEV
jgi:hypothetical protein